jgi:hypothetical protein
MSYERVTLPQRASQSLSDPTSDGSPRSRGFLVSRPHFRASVAKDRSHTDCWQELGIAVVEQALRDLHAVSPHVRHEAGRAFNAEALEPWIALACGDDLAAAQRVQDALRLWTRSRRTGAFAVVRKVVPQGVRRYTPSARQCD